jgi:protein HOOK3
VRNLEHYYHEGLGKDAAFAAVDLAKIARESNVDAILHLVEFVAAAAVTCDNKSEYVKRIMRMTPEAQVEMKGILQSSLRKLSDYENEDNGDDDDDDDGEEIEMAFGHQAPEMSDAPRNLFGSGHHDTLELEEQLAEARRELAAVKSQAVSQSEDNELALTKLRSVVEDLQDRLVKRQDELIQVEEDLQNATSELEDTKSKLLELKEEKTRLADDLDVANAKAQQLHKAEATLQMYKKKLETTGGMNQQMTEMEDQSAKYVAQIMDLEAQVKKTKQLEREVDELRVQVKKLEKAKETGETAKKTSADDISDLKSQLRDANDAKRMFEEELSVLRSKQETMHAQQQSSAGIQLAEDNIAYQEEKAKASQLRSENNLLRAELEQLKVGATDEELQKAEAASDAAKVNQEEVDKQTAIYTAEIESLKEELAKAQKENGKILFDKEKLEIYTKRTLAKFQDKYLIALQECKAKLKEKQDKIEALEQRSASERTAQKREERLLSSTIYELGMAIMQTRLRER